MSVAFTLTRTVPRITVIATKVIYPGVNNLKFDSEAELQAFQNDPSYKEGMKTGYLRIDNDPIDPVVTKIPVTEIKPIWPSKEVTEKRPGKKRRNVDDSDLDIDA